MDGGSKILKSTCYGCHGGCSVLLHVENERLVKVEGDPDGPLNHGSICPMGVSAPDLVYHPDRLDHPLKRVGPRGSGQWQRISWDEAMSTIAEKVDAIRKESGPEAIVMGTGTGRHLCRWVIRFANALGTPNWIEPGTAQCFIPRVKTCLMTYGAFAVGDFTHSTAAECIMYWGHNPLNSGPDGETRFASRENLMMAKHVIAVDPRENDITKRADIWLRLRPGTDDAVALAMLHTIIEEKLYDAEFVAKWTHGFEQLSERVKQYSPEWAEPITWVSSEKIRAAARLWAAAKPAQLEWGCAIEHTPNTLQTVRAISLLPALTGNIDIPGGWVFGPETLGNFNVLPGAVAPAAQEKILGSEHRLLTGGPGGSAAHIPAVMKAMREGTPYQVRAFLVFGNNALTTYANAKQTQEALEKVEFLTVTDFFMTPTAEMADIVLPACSWPELEGLHLAPFWSEYVVGPIQKAVQVAERRSDPDILVDLARRLNLDLGQESSDDVYATQLSQGEIKIDWESLKQTGSILVPLEYRKHETRGRFETPTGKIELYCTTLEQMGYDPLPYYAEPPESPLSAPEVAKDFPLVLTTGHRSKFFFHSEGRQIQRLRKAHKDPRIEIHPDTAGPLGIADGDWVWIETLRGRVRQRAKFSAAIDPRVVAAEHGWWFPENTNPDHGVWESNINVLTNNQGPYDPAMGTYQLRGLLCRVAKQVEP